MTAAGDDATLRQQLGCWVHERWRTEAALRLGGGRWRGLCNRGDRLVAVPGGGPGAGRECRWDHSRELTVARVFPRIGARLLAVAVPEIPLRWDGPPPATQSAEEPAVSVLVPVGGADRRATAAICLAALSAEAAAYAATSDGELGNGGPGGGEPGGGAEIVLAEQRAPGEPPADAPDGVRRVRVDDGGPFNKSRLLNRAAEVARGKVLVVHDVDLLPTRGYLRRCAAAVAEADAARPGRLIFYLNEATTARLVAADRPTAWHPGAECGGGECLSVERVVQNSPNPTVVRREAYFELGGHDESFEGWGGEDLEFLSRLRTRPTNEFGTEPLVHLWHPPAPKKASGHRNDRLQAERLAEPPANRIRRLRGRLGGAAAEEVGQC
ncbi:galactosyltransferase-related protein [Alienimonas sp. DA493]|uniref:galactosyltransferase-related protein n=1 Tax=Alienimonas sp. DA493 TaxID=3373605 RepID=UPI0037545EE9